MIKKLDVLCIGHILVDIRFLVDNLPGPDEEAGILDERRGVGGSAANVAIAVKRLGLNSGVIGKIGFDNFGRIAVDDLLREKIDISGLKISLTTTTGFSVVVRDSRGRIVIYGFKGAAEELLPNDLSVDLVSKTKYLHIASLRLDTTIKAIELAREYNVKVSWDPGRRLSVLGYRKLEKIINSINILFANEKEIQNITGIRDYREASKYLIDKGPEIIIVKRGDKGVYVLTSEKEYIQPACPVETIVDTTGAGDSFAAGFLSGLIRRFTLEDTIKYASIVAALKVSRLGSHNTPTHNEVLKYGEKNTVCKLTYPKP
ncbi:MAG: phosphofructokinase [Desulfurococcales archaeon ex4484_58]|nr:MAG: phosphofructokinase [Desulfurococcales archaeon ex4484_58]